MGELNDCGTEGSVYLSSVSGVSPEPGVSHTATVVGKRIFFFGGEKEGRLVNDVYILDTISGRWIIPKVLGTPPVPRCAHSAVTLNGDRILILGGNSAMPYDAIWSLEVETPFVKRQRQRLGEDVVAWSKGVLGKTPKPIVICGPSGVGKGTLISRLMEDFPSMFGFSVSHTTRSPRQKEKDGVHYHFVKRNVMELEVQEGKFLESADVHGNLYGTSIATVEAVADSGKRCILDIDVQGAQAVKESTLDALFIFIAPPSFEELEKRLRGRGTETEEQIQKRLRNAKAELEQAKNSTLFDHTVVNDNLDECYLQLKKLLGLNSKLCAPTQNGTEQPGELEPRSGHSASVVGQKIFMCGGKTPDGRALNNVVVVDASSLVGGAPGRTWGFKCHALESKSISSNGLTPLQYPSRQKIRNTDGDNHQLVKGS